MDILNQDLPLESSELSKTQTQQLRNKLKDIWMKFSENQLKLI
jgi:hypothetical protein